MKIIKIVCITILVGVVIVVASAILYRFAISPENLMAYKVNVSDSYINLSVIPFGSGVQYRGHKTEFKDGILYVTVYGGMFRFSKTGFNNLAIKNKYGDIKEIYLKGKPSSPTRLIWPKQ